MTDPDRHPSAFALESLAVGETNDTAEATRAHVDTCPHCAAHVAGLRRDALAFENEPLPAYLLKADSSGGTADIPRLQAVDSPRATANDMGLPQAVEIARTTANDIGASQAVEISRETANDRRPSQAVEISRETANAVARLHPVEAPRITSAPRPTRSRALVRTSWAFIPLAIAALAMFALRPTPPPGSEPAPLFPTPTDPAIRFKGGPALAVVRERSGQQERLTGSVMVLPHDRLRVELAVDTEGTYEAGLLGHDGSWVVLLAPTMLRPGAHFSERAAHFDASPEPSWILAGAPDDVALARKSHDFSKVAALPVGVASAAP